MARRAVGAWCLGRHGKRPERRVLRGGSADCIATDCALLRHGHTNPTAPHPVRSAKLSGFRPG